MKTIPIILDTDPGVDDFFAIAIACGFNDIIDLQAITTIGGNNSTDTTTKNALDILKLLNRQEVAVSKGAERFLEEEFGEPVVKFHGKNGIADIQLSPSNKKIDPLKAEDKIYEVAKKFKKELVLVTVGPETNLALAFNKYPDLKDMIKKIVVMAGSLTTGNINQYAEANIYHDTKAARIVFESGVPIDMIGLNVTRKAPLKKNIFDDLIDIDETIKDVMYKLIEFRNEEAMHDAIAISSLISDDIIKFKEAYTYIIDADEPRKGMSVVDYDRPANSRVAVDIDVEKYYELMKNMINRFKKQYKMILNKTKRNHNNDKPQCKQGSGSN